LRGMVQALRSSEPEAAPESDLLPTWDFSGTPARNSPASASAESAAPVGELPSAERADFSPEAAAPLDLPETEPKATREDEKASSLASPVAQTADAVTPKETESPTLRCPSCRAPRHAAASHCDDCGWVFQASEPNSDSRPQAITRIRERYEI